MKEYKIQLIKHCNWFTFENFGCWGDLKAWCEIAWLGTYPENQSKRLTRRARRESWTQTWDTRHDSGRSRRFGKAQALSDWTRNGVRRGWPLEPHHDDASYDEAETTRFVSHEVPEQFANLNHFLRSIVYQSSWCGVFQARRRHFWNTDVTRIWISDLNLEILKARCRKQMSTQAESWKTVAQRRRKRVRNTACCTCDYRRYR